MKKSVMKKWVKALRSGEYLQCTGSLTEKDGQGNDTFCCLGVLTNLYVEENGISKLKIYDSEDKLGFWDQNEDGAGLLCNTVRDWSGMKSDKGTIHNFTNLASLNDGGKSFNEIADIIESEYEEL